MIYEYFLVSDFILFYLLAIHVSWLVSYYKLGLTYWELWRAKFGSDLG